MRDGIPNNPKHYRLHKQWILTAHEGEIALTNRNRLITKSYNKSAKELPPLPIGTNVVIQNRFQNNKKWEKAGTIVEILPHRQYRVKLEGSG